MPRDAHRRASSGSGGPARRTDRFRAWTCRSQCPRSALRRHALREAAQRRVNQRREPRPRAVPLALGARFLQLCVFGAVDAVPLLCVSSQIHAKSTRSAAARRPPRATPSSRSASCADCTRGHAFCTCVGAQFAVDAPSDETTRNSLRRPHQPARRRDHLQPAAGDGRCISEDDPVHSLLRATGRSTRRRTRRAARA